MKIRFVWIGKTKNNAIQELTEDYMQRIRKFAAVEVATLKDRSAAATSARRVEMEGADILARTEADPFVVLLSERGKQMPSKRFARFIEDHMSAGTKEITFVIGGADGVTPAVEKRADLSLGLSEMTLTHEMARLFLAEQVYRAFTIIKNHPYQK